MNQKLTKTQIKAAGKWIEPMVQLLHDPALWSLKMDLTESNSPEATLYLFFVNTEIVNRLNTAAKTSRRSYEEITDEASSN